MAHTPGEWELQLDGIDYRVVSQAQYTPIVVATVHATDENDDIGSREGNGRLVAAAPELLAALMALTDKVDATSDCDHKRARCEDIGCIGVQVKSARAAIAKAKGGAQ